MPLRGASHYRARSVTVALVVGGHLAVILMLATRSTQERHSPPDEPMLLTFIEIPAAAARPAGSPSLAQLPARSEGLAPAARYVPALTESTGITPGIDWYGEASDAASRAATKPDVRDFGYPKREPEARAKKEFGWDKTHTERISALPEGGMLIRLNDNCAIIIAPLPFGGCTIGKRKARGDLFDEMQAPVEPGDWK
jgi:hypothetical protein